MPAPRPVRHEIEELQLDHHRPWTHQEMKHHRHLRNMEQSWFLVARGSTLDIDMKFVGSTDDTIQVSMVEVEQELS